MNNHILTVVMALLCLTFYTSCTFEKDTSPIHISWNSPTSSDIGTIAPILAASGIGGCGEFYVGTHKGETKIACTSDGVNFIYYDIWESIEKVNRTPTEIYERYNKPNF